MLDRSWSEVETQRLQALRRLQILDTQADPAFDNLIEITANLFTVPVAWVSLLDERRQWFKSSVGFTGTELPREGSFCTHAIEADSPLIVEDAHLDQRFRRSPLVQGPPYIRLISIV